MTPITSQATVLSCVRASRRSDGDRPMHAARWRGAPHGSPRCAWLALTLCRHDRAQKSYCWGGNLGPRALLGSAGLSLVLVDLGTCATWTGWGRRIGFRRLANAWRSFGPGAWLRLACDDPPRWNRGSLLRAIFGAHRRARLPGKPRHMTSAYGPQWRAPRWARAICGFAGSPRPSGNLRPFAGEFGSKGSRPRVRPPRSRRTAGARWRSATGTHGRRVRGSPSRHGRCRASQ